MKKITRKVDLFYIPWILMVIHLCVANSNAAEFSVSIISYGCILLFLLKIVWTGRYSIKQIIFMGMLLVISILAIMKSKDMRFLWFALALCASKGIDFDKTIKYSMITTLICCISFVVLYFLGVIDGAQSVSVRGIRYSFGLGHPNMCSAYYALLMVYLLYLYYEKIKIKHVVLFICGTLIIYYFTRSNTGFIVSIFSIITFFIMKYIPLKRMNTRLIIIVLIGIIIAFTLMPILYSDKLELLDTLMTGRLHQSNYYFQKYGISILGNDVSADLLKWNTDNILDLGYARMLIYNGAAYYALVVMGYIINLFCALKTQNRKLLILLGTMIIYMATENVATYIFMNASMVFFSRLIFESGKTRKELKI